MPLYSLSKSTTMLGRQCTKALWLNRHRRGLRAKPTAAQQAVLDNGTNVGLLARERFPGGTDCDPDRLVNIPAMLQATQDALNAGATVLYEAAFLHDEVLVLLDILVRDSDGWTAVEVKSATTAKDQFVADAALQHLVITTSGLPLQRVQLMLINNQYVRQGPIDVQQLFRLEDVTAQALAMREGLMADIARFKAVLAQPQEPDKDIGPHCHAPYTCPFRDHCWAHVPTPSVFDLPRIGAEAYALEKSGVVRIQDVPPGTALSAVQQRHVEAHRTGLPQIDAPAVRAFVDGLRYPLHHLDFETIFPSVPLFDGTRPYQQVPFQYSLHVEDAPGAAPHHQAFLGDGQGDPRAAFVQQMLADIGPEGDILVYNSSFESGIIGALAEAMPHHAAALLALRTRIKDLLVPFRQGWYCHPGFGGSNSLKAVLPALVPRLSYSRLAIQDGGAASDTFLRLLLRDPQLDPAIARKDLLDYCHLDTLAMVEVLAVLRGV
jgi:hypothetical protein